MRSNQVITVFVRTHGFTKSVMISPDVNFVFFGNSAGSLGLVSSRVGLRCLAACAATSPIRRLSSYPALLDPLGPCMARNRNVVDKCLSVYVILKTMHELGSKPAHVHVS